MSENPRKDVRRTLSVILTIALVVASLGVIYYIVFPAPANKSYTEFYVLNSSDEAANYPTNLSIGETGAVILGVENHEHQRVTYTLNVKVSDKTILSRRITVSEGGMWRDRVAISFESAGRKPVQLQLYRGPEPKTGSDPYRELWIIVNVTET